MKLDNNGELGIEKNDIKELRYDIKWIKEALRILICEKHNQDASNAILKLIDIKADISQYK